MAAPLGFKTFNTGDVLSAADTNGYLMQGIWVFANAAARDAAVTSPQEGNSCYLKDTDVIQVYSGSSWVVKSGGSSPLTTKGDLYTYSTTDARLPVGANGTTLVADSSEATGLKWATAASGGGMTLISETVASSNSSLSFSSLGSYKQLLLIWNGINTSNSTTTFNIRFNNDSGSNYSTAQMGSGGINNMGSGTDLGANLQNSFVQDCTSTTLGERGRGYWLIDNYTSTTKYKTAYGQIAYKEAQYNTKMNYMSFSTYESQSAVTSVDIVRTTGSGTFSNATNTTIRLYGIS